jgi:zinc protease
VSAPEVFIEPSAALPLVSVLIAFRSGSAHDPPGKEGLARSVARMLRRGAEGLSAQAIEEAIDALGGELATGASMSATTVQFEVIRRSLDRFVDLVATLLAKPAFDEAELGRLLREAEAELVEAQDSDASLASRAFRKTLFRDHVYGRRVAGRIQSLSTLTCADVRAFYERHYTRQNAVVAVSGAVTEAEAEAIAARLLAGLPEGASVADPAPPPERRAGRHLVFVDKPARTQTQMLVGGLGTDPRDADHFALIVANTAFGGTFTSRLMQEVRAKRGWSYGASSRVGFDRQRDAFTMSTAPAATDAAACLTLELELLHALREDGVTSAELEFVKRYIVRSHAFEIDTAKKRVHHKLEAALLGLPEGYHATYLAQIEAVPVDAAALAVRARLSEDDLVVSVVGTYAELGPAIEGAIPSLTSVEVLPFDFDA